MKFLGTDLDKSNSKKIKKTAYISKIEESRSKSNTKIRTSVSPGYDKKNGINNPNLNMNSNFMDTKKYVS